MMGDCFRNMIRCANMSWSALGSGYPGCREPIPVQIGVGRARGNLADPLIPRSGKSFAFLQAYIFMFLSERLLHRVGWWRPSTHSVAMETEPEISENHLKFEVCKGNPPPVKQPNAPGHF